MSEQKNVSSSMVPADRTVPGASSSRAGATSRSGRRPTKEVYKIALADLLKMGYGVTEAEVDAYYVADSRRRIRSTS